MRASNLVGFLVLPAALYGCAGTATFLRSEPSGYIDPMATTVVDPELAPFIRLKCMKTQPQDWSDRSASQPCLYAAIDLSQIKTAGPTPMSDATRNKAISFLFLISDINCSNFLDRAQANVAGMNFTKGLVGDLATATSAGTTFSNPALSSGLGLGNLVIGKSVEAFDSAYYLNQTFQAFQASVYAERARLKAGIVTKQSAIAGNGPAYDMFQALIDFREYDDACSMRRGLEKLASGADKTKENNENLKRQVEGNPQNGASMLRSFR